MSNRMLRYPEIRRREEEMKCEIENKNLFNHIYFSSRSLVENEFAFSHELLEEPPISENLFKLEEANPQNDEWNYITSESFKLLIETFKPHIQAAIQNGLFHRLMFKTVEIEIVNYRYMTKQIETRFCILDLGFIQFMLLSTHEVKQLLFYIKNNLVQLRANNIKFWTCDCRCLSDCWVIEKRDRISPKKEFSTICDDLQSSHQSVTIDQKIKGNLMESLYSHLRNNECYCKFCDELKRIE